MKKIIKKRFLRIIIILAIFGVSIGSYFIFRSPYKFRGSGVVKILVLNSYHPDFPVGLVDESLKGFKDSLEKNGLKKYEIKEINLDYNRKDSEEAKLQTAVEAKKEIDSWKPDLIFTTNDEAQKYVISPYFLKSDIPIVFASVINKPESYGFNKVKNITGVLQTPLFSTTINFLKQLFPNVKKIAVISEDDSRWSTTIDGFKKYQDQIPEIEFIGWNRFINYKDFKNFVLLYQTRVDALLITPLDNLKDESGKNVQFLTVTKWLVENSHLPEISFWKIPTDGLFAAVTYSPYEQGAEAGRLAYKILIEGKRPISLGFKNLDIGDRYLNIARAESLGLKQEDIPSTILINSKIIKKFPWQE